MRLPGTPRRAHRLRRAPGSYARDTLLPRMTHVPKSHAFSGDWPSEGTPQRDSACLQEPGFHDLVGFRASAHVDRRVELVAGGNQELSLFGYELVVIVAGYNKLRVAMVGRAFAMNVEPLNAFLAPGWTGGRADGQPQEQAVSLDPIRLTDGEHSQTMVRSEHKRHSHQASYG